MNKKIELIVPCYNEEKCVELFYKRIKEVFQELKSYDLLITFIDDGSKDNTINEIKKLVEKDVNNEIQYISLSRNFGKESAIYAGLSNSTGDYVVLLDADLQHPPELIIQMLEAVEKEGYDCASARRVSRKGEPVFRSVLSQSFYHLINRVTVIDLVPGSTDYRLMKRVVVDAIVSMSEHERFTKGIYAWVGFKNKWIEYENVERVAGSTKWNIRGLFRYAYSGFISFATTPLRGIIYLGMLTVIVSVILAIYIYISAITNPNAQRNGYASIMILLLFLGGVIITILGMIGEYLARIFMEVKNRPIYFARDQYFVAEKSEQER